MSVNPRQPAVLEAPPVKGGGVSWKKGFWMVQNLRSLVHLHASSPMIYIAEGVQVEVENKIPGFFITVVNGQC